MFPIVSVAIPRSDCLEPCPTWWPSWLIVASSLVIFAPLLEGGTTHLAVMTIRLQILSLLALAILHVLAGGRVNRPSLGLVSPVVAFLGLAGWWTMTSPYVHQSAQWLLSLFCYGLLLCVLMALLRSWTHVGKLLGILVAMGLVEASAALVQTYGQAALRPSGTFFNPNYLAGYLAAVLCIVLGPLCYAKFTGMPSRRKWILRSLLAAGMLGWALIETGSRGGLLAFVIGASAVIGLRFGRKAATGLVGVVLIAVVFAANPIRDRIVAEHRANPEAYARWHIWSSSLRAVMDHPLGVGLGLYQYVYPRYAEPIEGEITRYGKTAQTAHSEYVQLAVELGIPGLMVAGWGLMRFGREVRRTLQLRLSRFQRGLLVGTAAAAVSLLVQAGVDATFHEPALAIVFTLCVAVLSSVPRLQEYRREALAAVPVRLKSLWGGVAAVAVGGLALLVVKMGLAWLSFDLAGKAMAQHDRKHGTEGYAQAVRLDPGTALYRSALAAAHFHRYEQTRASDAADAALRELIEASRLNPLDGRLFELQGRVHVALAGHAAEADAQQRVHRERAVIALEEALRLEPYKAQVRFDLARLYEQLGELGKAEALVRETIALEPNFLPGREWLAYCVLRIGRAGEARGEYREIVARQAEFASWTKIPLEHAFLSVDAARLAGALAARGEST